MYFSGSMIGFLMGLVSEVVHSHTGVPTAMPGATPLGSSIPDATASPQEAPTVRLAFPGSFLDVGAPKTQPIMNQNEGS